MAIGLIGLGLALEEGCGNDQQTCFDAPFRAEAALSDHDKYIGINIVELKKDGDPLLTYDQYTSAITRLNDAFGSKGYHFYIKDIHTVYDTPDDNIDLADGTSLTESHALMNPFVEEGVLNVFMAPDFVYSGKKEVEGLALNSYLIVDKHADNFSEVNFVHEVGHYGGLQHTHQPGGDNISDTPMDRGDEWHEELGISSEPGSCKVNLETCEVIQCEDQQGGIDFQHPLIDNYMGYYGECGNSFTAEQLDVWDCTMQTKHGDLLQNAPPIDEYQRQTLIKVGEGYDIQTLEDAILRVADGGIIELQKGVYELGDMLLQGRRFTIRGSEGEDIIIKRHGDVLFDIQGSTINFENIVFDGNNGLLFNVSNGSEVVFNSVEIKNCQSDRLGHNAIYSQNSVIELNQVDVHDNRGAGSVIYCGGGSLLIRGSEFNNNDGTSTLLLGMQQVEMSHTAFNGNTGSCMVIENTLPTVLLTAVSFVGHRDDSGYGIMTLLNSSVSLKQCSWIDNVIEGSAVTSIGSGVTLNECTFNNNTFFAALEFRDANLSLIGSSISGNNGAAIAMWESNGNITGSSLDENTGFSIVRMEDTVVNISSSSVSANWGTTAIHLVGDSWLTTTGVRWHEELANEGFDVMDNRYQGYYFEDDINYECTPDDGCFPPL